MESQIFYLILWKTSIYLHSLQIIKFGIGPKGRQFSDSDGQFAFLKGIIWIHKGKHSHLPQRRAMEWWQAELSSRKLCIMIRLFFFQM